MHCWWAWCIIIIEEKGWYNFGVKKLHNLDVRRDAQFGCRVAHQRRPDTFWKKTIFFSLRYQYLRSFKEPLEASSGACFVVSIIPCELQSVRARAATSTDKNYFACFLLLNVSLYLISVASNSLIIFPKDGAVYHIHLIYHDLPYLWWLIRRRIRGRIRVLYFSFSCFEPLWIALDQQFPS